MASTTEVRAGPGGRGVRHTRYSEAELADRVAVMGREITAHYPAGEDVLVLGLLKGSFMFLADLVRQVRRPIHVDFIVAASYGSGTVSSGDVKLVYDPSANMNGRHV